MDRQEWLERRRRGIGGTDAAAILGVSKYRTAVDVWQDKTRRTPLETAVSAPMRWGLLLEGAIATAYQEDTGRKVRRSPLRVHPTLRFAIGSPDRLAGARLVEIKTTRSDDELAPKGGELDVEPAKRIPAAWYVQVQHYLGILDFDVADVAVLVGGSDFRIIEIPADRDFIRDLFVEEGLWWNEYVLEDRQPPVGPDDGAFLSGKYPTSIDDELVATAEIRLTVDEILELRDRIDVLERERDARENRVKEYLGAYARLVVDGASVTWKANDRRTTSWKEVATELRGAYAGALGAMAKLGVIEEAATRFGRFPDPDAIEATYAQTATVRPFRIARKKEGTR